MSHYSHGSVMVRTLCIWFCLTILGAIALLELSLKFHPTKHDEFRAFPVADQLNILRRGR